MAHVNKEGTMNNDLVQRKYNRMERESVLT